MSIAVETLAGAYYVSPVEKSFQLWYDSNIMEEYGLVVDIKSNNVVLIKAERSSSCEKCMTKEMCYPADDDKSMMIEAEDPIGVKKGDKVVFSVGAATVLKAGVMLYLIPLLFFIAGVVAGQVAGSAVAPGFNKDLLSALLGFLFLICAFIGLKFYGRRAEEGGEYRPTVTRVVEK